LQASRAFDDACLYGDVRYRANACALSADRGYWGTFAVEACSRFPCIHTHLAKERPMPFNPLLNAAHFNELGRGHLPQHLSISVLEVGERFLISTLSLQPHHLAPNGFLHAASVIALADTSAGYGCLANLPEGIESFTTIELKANFVSTITAGAAHCEARAIHMGRTIQLWEARVTDAATGRLMATFACSQMLLASRRPGGTH
jgi:uncharacterized protein (TIGR00369 family)